MARSYTSEFEPSLRLGENVLLFPRGPNAKAKRSDGANNIHRIINIEAFPGLTVNLGAVSAAAAGTTSGAGSSTDGTKTSLKSQLEQPKNQLLQLRFTPLLDFEVALFQPADVPHYRTLLNDYLRVGYGASNDTRGDPQNEFWHYEDASISMTATNPHRRALSASPVKLRGWAYKLQPRPVEMVIADVKAVIGPDRGAMYDRIYTTALDQAGGDTTQANEAVILQMIRNGHLRALYAPVEASF